MRIFACRVVRVGFSVPRVRTRAVRADRTIDCGVPAEFSYCRPRAKVLRAMRTSLLVLLIGFLLNIVAAFAMWQSACPHWRVRQYGIATAWRLANDQRTTRGRADSEAKPWTIPPPSDALFAEIDSIEGVWPEHRAYSSWSIARSSGARGMQCLSWAWPTFTPDHLGGCAGGVVMTSDFSGVIHDGVGPMLRNEFRTLDVADFGWPFLSFRYAEAFRSGLLRDMNTTMLWQRRGDAAFLGFSGWTSSPAFALPVPLWRGVAINTFLLGAGGLIAKRAAFAIARILRHYQHSLCLHCGYPREGLASRETPCPECSETQSLSPPTAL